MYKYNMYTDKIRNILSYAQLSNTKNKRHFCFYLIHTILYFLEFVNHVVSQVDLYNRRELVCLARVVSGNSQA